MVFAWGLWHTYYYASAQISTYDYESLISRVDQYCYTELVKNASCCMDQEFAEGVRKVTVKRPGTGWFCDKKLCYDDLKGHRGGGTMWIPHGDILSPEGFRPHILLGQIFCIFVLCYMWCQCIGGTKGTVRSCNSTSSNHI